jgi:hypothetical protein
MVNFLTITLPDGYPRQNLRINIHSFFHNNSIIRKQELFTPSSFFIPKLESPNPVVLTASLSRPIVGTYFINSSLSDLGSALYEVEYLPLTSAPFLTLKVLLDIIPAPELVSAVFTADGSSMMITFSGDTNKGSGFSQFLCSTLFDFACANISTCTWTDFSHIMAYVATKPYCASPGQSLALAVTSQIKARCIVRCNNQYQWPIIPVNSSTLITAPSNKLNPKVVINMPDSVGSCATVSIDITSSSGDGGRGWTSIRIFVTGVNSMGSSINTDELQSFINSANYSSFPPTPIAANFLIPGTAYTFRVELCNFLGSCGIGTKKLSVLQTLLPVISIPGTKTVTIKRNAILSIVAQGFIPMCKGDNDTSTSAAQPDLRFPVFYDWNISSQQSAKTNFVSLSKDPSRCLLRSFSLDSNVTYIVTATARAVLYGTEVSAFTSIKVYVQPGNININLQGGNVRSVRVKESINIDASRSIDEDMNTVEQTLLFQWSCLQVAPVLSASCSGIFDQLAWESTNKSPVLRLVASNDASEAVAQVSLVVQDNTGTKSAQSTIEVSILPSLAPVVELTSSVGSSKASSYQALQLIGKVDVPSSLAGFVYWNIDQSSGIDISSVALGAVNMSILTNPIPKSYNIYLPLNARLLPTNVNLLFTLKCVLFEPGNSSDSSISVLVNAPPRPGMFEIRPDSGIELKQSFSFVCSRWLDDDLPLSYQFGFVTTNGEQMVLRSRLQTSYADLVLPAGSVVDNFFLSGLVQVYDSLNGNNSAIAKVQVLQEITFGTDQLANFVASSLAENVNSIDGIKQGAAMSSYLLNRVNCSQAPDCASINRKACYRTPNTCGPCISDQLYIGDNGDSNERCVLISELQSSNTNSTCVGIECGPVMVNSTKTCPSACSGHGQCMFSSVISGQPLDWCAPGDFSCEASCNCVDGYGGTSCGLTLDEIKSRQQMRQDVIVGLLRLTTIEDADAQSLQSLITNVNSVSQSIDELSTTSSAMILDVASYIMTNVPSAGLTSDATAGILVAVEASLSSVYTSTNSNISTANSTIVSSSAIVHQSQEVIDLYTSYVADSLVPGQIPFTTVQNSFRIHVSSHNFPELVSASAEESMLCDNASISFPRKASEEIVGVQTGGISVPLCPQHTENSSYTSISAVSISGDLYQRRVSDHELQSNPFRLSMSSFPCADDGCWIDFVLSRQRYNTSIVQIFPEKYNVTCKSGDYSIYYHTCPDGESYPIECRGDSEIIQGECPFFQPTPSCSALLSDLPVDFGCKMLDLTVDNITCSCPLLNLKDNDPSNIAGDGKLSAQNNRYSHLLDTNSTSDIPSGEISIDYVSMLIAMQTKFVSTVLSAGDLSGAAVARSYQVILTLGSFAGAVIVALYLSFKADQRAIKVDEEHKANKEKKFSLLQVFRGTKKPNTYKDWMQSMQKQQIGVFQMAEEALPKVLSSRSYSTLIKEELKRHHRWFGIMFHYSDKFPRALRVASLATNIVTMLFIQSITYSLTSGDDNTCETYLSQGKCLEEPSAFATGESKCYWLNDSADGVNCHYVQPDQSMKVVIFVAVFSSLVSMPIAVLSDYLISNILSAPTRTIAPIKSSFNAANTSIVPIKPVAAAPGRRKMMIANVVQRIPGSADDADDEAENEVQAGQGELRRVPLIFAQLVKNLNQYLNQLQDEKDKAEFRSKLYDMFLH